MDFPGCSGLARYRSLHFLLLTAYRALRGKLPLNPILQASSQLRVPHGGIEKTGRGGDMHAYGIMTYAETYSATGCQEYIKETTEEAK